MVQGKYSGSLISSSTATQFRAKVFGWQSSGFGVELRVQGVGFRVQGSGFRGLGFRVEVLAHLTSTAEPRLFLSCQVSKEKNSCSRLVVFIGRTVLSNRRRWT